MRLKFLLILVLILRVSKQLTMNNSYCTGRGYYSGAGSTRFGSLHGHRFLSSPTCPDHVWGSPRRWSVSDVRLTTHTSNAKVKAEWNQKVWIGCAEKLGPLAFTFPFAWLSVAQAWQCWMLEWRRKRSWANLRHILPGITEENHWKPHTGKSVYGMKFEPRTCRGMKQQRFQIYWAVRVSVTSARKCGSPGKAVVIKRIGLV